MSGTQPKKPEMQRIPFPTESAELDSPANSLEQLLNFYIEASPDQARSKVSLKSTPGLAAVNVYGTGPIFAMNTDLPGRLYIVSGAELFVVTNIGPTNMGNVGISTYSPPTPVTIATGPVQVVVCVPPNCYAANVSETTFHLITGPAGSPFPGASSVAYIDGYFVFTAASDSSKFFCTALFDPATVDALDFAYADAVPNVIRRVMTHLSRLWFLGEAGIEIWYDSGDVDFPFRRDAGGIIPYGVMSPKSAAICDGSIFWLGINGIVFRTDGYAAKRVSTHSIEERIREYLADTGTPGFDVACAISFVVDGHSFYALTMQKAGGDPGFTIVYDCASGRWHDRSSATIPGVRWRVNAAALSGTLLLGDVYSGKIYIFRDSEPTDDGVQVRHIAVFPPLWNSTRRAFMSRLEIETDVGAQPITLDWTDDAGTTWNGARVLPTSGKRVATTRLGSFRERTIRLAVSGKSRIHGVDAFVESGDA